MKNRKRYRHGDVVLKEVKRVPSDAKRERARPLAFGETTGHSHRFREGEYQIFTLGGRNFIDVKTPATLIHEEHRALTIQPGVYEQFAEREFDYTKTRARTVVD